MFSEARSTWSGRSRTENHWNCISRHGGANLSSYVCAKNVKAQSESHGKCVAKPHSRLKKLIASFGPKQGPAIDAFSD